MSDEELSDAAARAERQAALEAPRIAPLVPYVKALRARHPDRAVPWPDPFDGGAEASILFLLEKPSRKAAEAEHAAFISRDNPSNGARTLKRLLEEAGVPRRKSLIWNAVPWWNGRTAVTAAELKDGAAALTDLLALLPHLRSVVLVGRKAEAAWAMSPGAAVPVFASAHFSANVRAAFPDRWAAIPKIWAEAYSAAAIASASPKT